MQKAFILCVISIIFLQTSAGQKIDNHASFRDIKSTSYFRFNYDNDFFAATDENYTQGYSFELVLPYFKINPLNNLFYKPKSETIETRYGLSVEHIGYTPNRYEVPEIQVGDRPFAAAIYLKSFMIATDVEKKSRFTSSFSLGFIGPAAFGEEMQRGIHKWTENKTPLGWGNQIKNDIVLNYEAGYEKQLLSYNDILSLQATANAKVGTLFTNGSIGLITTIGLINSPLTSTSDRNGFKIYAYGQPIVSVVGYDATLQGGVFNTKSPYTIASSDVERVTGQFKYGIVIKTKTLFFEYSQAVIIKEHASGSGYSWGGIKVGFTI